MFDVSRTVIRQALNELALTGMVRRERGRGTFVVKPKIRERLVQKLTGFYQDMKEQGYVPVTQVLKQAVVPASSQVAARLEIDAGTEVIEIERLRFVEDVPLNLVTTYIPYALCPVLLHEDLSHQSLYGFLETRYGLVVARGRRTIEAVLASPYEAQLLRVEIGAPLILLDSVSFLSDGTPLEYYQAYHRGDRSKFEVELVRLPEDSPVPGSPPADRDRR